MANASEESDLALFDSMLLLSVLSTAADVRHRIEQRRIGRDPSAQEEASYVRGYLADVLDELEEGFLRLYFMQVPRKGRETVRRMDQRLLLQRLRREVHVVHQRLLSLYPDVSEDMVEQVRLLERRCAELLEAAPDTFARDVSDLVGSGIDCTSRLRRSL